MEFVVAIVAIVVGIPVVLGIGLEVYKRHVSFKEKQLELMADQTAEKAAQYAAHVERLEQRMRVLERIATDKGSDLADRIEGLRDEPVPALADSKKELN